MGDEEIIHLLFERKEAALSVLDEKYGNHLYCLSMRILNNKEDVEECVNDTYYAAWKSIPPENPKSLGAWLSRVLRNCSIDRYRKNNAGKQGVLLMELTREMEECIPTEIGEREENALTESIQLFLEKLPREQRYIVLRRYWYMDTISDICGRTGMGQSKVKSILFRARKKLKHQLQEEGIARKGGWLCKE